MPDEPLVDFSEMSRNLEAVIGKYQPVADRLLMQTGMAVEKDARDRAPVDTGQLRASGQTIGPEERRGPDPPPAGAEASHPFPETPKHGEVIVAFTAGHAAAVHENLDAHHDVGEAKYLEKAVQEIGPQMMERIGRDLMREVAP